MGRGKEVGWELRVGLEWFLSSYMLIVINWALPKILSIFFCLVIFFFHQDAVHDGHASCRSILAATCRQQPRIRNEQLQTVSRHRLTN